MKKEHFNSTLLEGHKGAAVEVPFDPAKRWGIAARQLWRGRRGHQVRGALNDVQFNSCIVPRMGRFWMLVDPDLQAAASVSPGQVVRVSLEPAPSSIQE